MANKLGSHRYYFDQMVQTKAKGSVQNPLPTSHLVYTKTKFVTTRTFENVFFEQRKQVRDRVQFFLEHRDWYEKKGIPYTLGFMFHGPPGTGKTSSIKAIANAGRRHIINIQLSEVKTKYICLLNPDAFLTYEATAEAMEKLREDANQLLAPNFFDSTGNFTASLRSGYPLSRLIEDLIPSPKNISRKIVSKVLGERVGSDFPWLIGACVFSSTKFLVDIGGLDQSYFLYMEDVELGRQACKKGLVQSLESPIEHYGRQSTDKSEIFIATELSKARLKYLRRHFGFWPWVLIVFVHKLNTYYNHLLKS
jgi:hypothetical protein